MAKSEIEKKDIEDANRLAVIAGDFLMAAASSQLAELENQCVVSFHKNNMVKIAILF